MATPTTKITSLGWDARAGRPWALELSAVALVGAEVAETAKKLPHRGLEAGCVVHAAEDPRKYLIVTTKDDEEAAIRPGRPRPTAWRAP